MCGISVSIGFRFSYVFCEAPGNILATMMLRNQLKAFSCLEVLIVKTEKNLHAYVYIIAISGQAIMQHW